MTNNPFSVHRAEYMKNLRKYYVPFKDFSVSADKATVIIGGRGTGKSMFFLCNSWREQYAAIEETSDSPIRDFLKQCQIGVYYKVDSTFVGAMASNDPTSLFWQGTFNTYFSVCLLIELLPLIQMLHENGVIDRIVLNNIFRVYSHSVRGVTKAYSTVDDIKRDCELVIQEIEDLINCSAIDRPAFRPTQPGTIYKSIINELHSVHELSDVVFKVYIDEYESFSENQQVIINTLIKQSDRHLIYNISLRHNGMKTQATLGENEIIQPTHDYNLLNLDDLLTGQNYEAALKDICKKRFELFFTDAEIETEEKYTDIEFYLSEYNATNEILRFEGKKIKFLKKLEVLIRGQCSDNDDTEEMVKVLCYDAPIINARLHLALLMRASHFRPTINKLYRSFLSWRREEKNDLAKEYRDWLHNAKNGLIFLLAKDCGLPKLYYGFDTFVALSSGVVRYFLELCEQVFNIAMIEGFEWTNPQPISYGIQTRAAKYVSQYKVNEIASYPLCGKRLRIFIQCFGEICRDLHRNDNTTLGEPEVNHFTTESLQLTEDVEKYLSDAITWLVLQRLPQTKSKESIRTDILDYHMNKIYTPYFEISYNKKRKIKLDVEQLEALFSSDVDIANKAARTFLDEYWGRKQKGNNTASQKGKDGSVVQLNIWGETN